MLSVAQRGFDNFAHESPLGSAEFLKNFSTILRSTFQAQNIDEAGDTKTILNALNWLCTFTLHKTLTKSMKLQSKKKLSAFKIRNEIQVFHANTLAICYAQLNVFRVFLEFVNKLSDSNEKNALQELLVLYGSNLIIKNAGIFYEGSYFKNERQIELYKNLVLNLLEKIKLNAISLVDSIAYPDHIINSFLGCSDGEVYKKLESTLFNAPGTFTRPEWWKDVIYKETYINSKL